MAKFGTSSSASVNFSKSAVSSTTAKTKGWESLGCINVDLHPTANSQFKLGMIALTVGNEQHVELFTSLMGDAKEKMAILTRILQKAVLDFKPAGGEADLSFLDGLDDFEPVETAKSDKEQVLGYINVSLPNEDGVLSALGPIKLYASDINQHRIFHSLNKAACVDKNLAAIKARLSSTFYPTGLGRTMIGGSAAQPAAKKGYDVLKAA